LKLNIDKSIATKERILLAIYLIVVTVFISVAFLDWAYDDPFITYRYAQNLAEGIGFVYNPGERILSTTTPLFTLLLSFFHLFTSEVHHLANLIGAISLVLGGLLLFDLSRSWNSSFVGWAGLLLYPTFPLVVSTLSSETPLYLALCIGGFAFYAREKYLFTAIITAFACLARPDGVLVPIILFADYMIRKSNQVAWKSVLVFSVILISWVVFAWIYFGFPLPVTLTVKQLQGSMEISQRFAEGLITIIRGYLNWQYILMGILAVAGFTYAFLKRRVWVVFLSWTLLYFLAYSLLGVSRYFWYYAPLIPGFVVSTGLGLTAIYDLSSKLVDRFSKFNSQYMKILPGILLIFLFWTNISNLRQMSLQNDNRYLIYKEVGEWLNTNTLPEDKIGLLETGIIGYYSRRSIVDFAGLIQPQVAQRLTPNATYEDSALWAVMNYDLNYLVLHENMYPRLEADYIEDNCVLVEKFEGEMYHYPQNIEIFGCRN
jgi:hypothetical protein